MKTIQKPNIIGQGAKAVLSTPGWGKLLIVIITLPILLFISGDWAISAQVNNPWARQAPLPTGRSLNSVDMISATEGWAVGEGGVILHTLDGGAFWTPQNSGTTGPLHDVRFLDALHGWATSGNTILFTTDGGQSWGAGSGVIGSLYAVDFADLSRGWAVGNGGAIYRTTDGGLNWSLQTSPTTSGLSEVDFVDNNNGWAVGANGTILRTSDGGAA